MPFSYSTDLTEYDDQWPPRYIFHDLINCGFIELDTWAGEAYQLRNFLGGLPVERTRIYPVLRSYRDKHGKKKKYLRLEVEVRSSRKTRRRVGVKLHHLVYARVHGQIPAGKEIHHKDGDIHHNGIWNLVALSEGEHRKVGKETGAHEHPNNVPTISANDPVVVMIKQLHQSGLSYREIEKEAGYSYSTCRRIIKGIYQFKDGA